MASWTSRAQLKWKKNVHRWKARDVGRTDRERRNGGTPVGYLGRAHLRREERESITEEKPLDGS
jgi:hypothetical protein